MTLQQRSCRALAECYSFRTRRVGRTWLYESTITLFGVARLLPVHKIPLSFLCRLHVQVATALLGCVRQELASRLLDYHTVTDLCVVCHDQ